MKNNWIVYTRKEALKGNPERQCSLGMCYFFGTQGVSKDKKEAIKWFLKSAEQGYTDAKFKLGTCYYHGEGVVEDKEIAKKWLTESAKDSGSAQFYLDNFGDPDIKKKYIAYEDYKERQRLEDEERDFWAGLDDYEREAWRHKLDMD